MRRDLRSLALVWLLVGAPAGLFAGGQSRAPRQSPAAAPLVLPLAAALPSTLAAPLAAVDIPRTPAAVQAFAQAALARAAADAGPAALASDRAALSRLRENLRDYPTSLQDLILDAYDENGSARERAVFAQAQARVDEAGRSWGVVQAEADALAAQPAPARDRLKEALRIHAAALSAAAKSPRLSGLSKPLVASALARRARSVRALRRRLDQAPESGVLAVVRGRGPNAIQRWFLNSLRPYSPGLDLERTAVGRWALEFYSPTGFADGWAHHFAMASGEQAKGFVALQNRGGLSWKAQVALHEGFHQGDAGYDKAVAAMELKFGAEDGAALAIALIEGYTEWRTRRAFDALIRDGLAGKGGMVPRLIAWSLKLRDAGGNAVRRARMDLMGHGYTPYVHLVEAIMDRKGGKQALEDFAARGDVSGLVSVLGDGKLEVLAALAGIEGRYSGEQAGRIASFPGAADVHIAEASSLTSWSAHLLASAAADGVSPAGARTIRGRAAIWVEELERSLQGMSWSERFDALDRFSPFDLDMALDPIFGQKDARETIRNLIESRLSRPRLAPGFGAPFLIAGSAMMLLLAWQFPMLGLLMAAIAASIAIFVLLSAARARGPNLVELALRYWD